MKAVLGIDPGSKGAAVLITKERQIETFRFCSKETPASFFWIAANHYDCAVCIEQVHSMPNDGKPAIFTFGRNYGRVEGMLDSVGLLADTEYIDPGVWQRALNLGGNMAPLGASPSERKAARKRAHQEAAKRTFPTLKVTLDLADALLIAEYKWQKYFQPSSSSSGAVRHVAKT